MGSPAGGERRFSEGQREAGGGGFIRRRGNVTALSDGLTVGVGEFWKL